MTVERLSQVRVLESDRSQEWHLELRRGIQKAAEVANCVVDGVEEISQINEVIAIGEKEQMWKMLQQKISKYRRLICLLSPITKIAVITASKDNQTIADLRFQLEIIVGFIFVRHGLRGVGRIAFKENVSQLLENMF